MISATVAGHLGADPEIATAGQSQVVRFRVASSFKRGDKETTIWVGCSWFEPAQGEGGTKGAGRG